MAPKKHMFDYLIKRYSIDNPNEVMNRATIEAMIKESYNQLSKDQKENFLVLKRHNQLAELPVSNTDTVETPMQELPVSVCQQMECSNVILTNDFP